MPSLHPLNTFVLSIKNKHYDAKTDCFTKNPLPVLLQPYYTFITPHHPFKSNKGR